MSRPLRNPRGDSPLNRLPTERQEALVEFAATHRLAEAVAWLGQEGVIVDNTTLSGWLSAQRLRQQLRFNAAAVQSMIHKAQSGSKANRRKWDPEEVQRVGQVFFSEMALQQQDPSIWNMTQRLALIKERLGIEQSKFKESLRSKLRLGLDAVAEAFRENPQAMMLYEQARALIDTETK
jgi:hypothetical protein